MNKLALRLGLAWLVMALLGVLGAGGCSSTSSLIADGKHGRYKVGGVYQVKGIKYRAHKNLNYVETGLASWYGKDFHGRRTANGEIYNMHKLTAAHKTLPIPTYVRVRNLSNGRSLVLRVNDRGPYKSDHGTNTRNRIIDVSRKAAEMLGFLRAGIARVEVRYIGRARPSNAAKLTRNVPRRLVPGEWRAVGEENGRKHYHLKTGTYRDRKLAELHRRRVIATELAPAKLRRERSSKKRDRSRWRLIIGPFEAKNEAEAARAILFTHGYNKLRILASRSR